MFVSLRCVNCGKYPAAHAVDAGYCPTPRPPPQTVLCGCIGNTGKPLFPGQIHEPECEMRRQNLESYAPKEPEKKAPSAVVMADDEREELDG